MPILFSLIITFSGLSTTSPAAVHVGVYQKFDQCMLQGMKLTADMGGELRAVQFHCVPVNG